MIWASRSSGSARALRRCAVLCGVLALPSALASCSSSRRLPSPFIFNSPGDVALACFDAEPGPADERVVLPLACCRTDTTREGDGCPLALERRLDHALVTQTQRGEVAAVDLDNAVVLDSERRVPGYTFVDVGGLPAAIVVPPAFPGREDLGPPWTYVAGREVTSIKAIATCRFRVGTTCGPELQLDPGQESAQTEVSLPEAPQDMLLDPDGRALWVSLPKAGLLARIDLGQLGADEQGGSSEQDPSVWPFATQADGSGRPRAPIYFVVPSGIDVQPQEPAPLADAAYQSVCGTEYAYQPSLAQLPLAARAVSSRRALPTRLRLLPGEPEQGVKPGSLLFVADAGQAVLHAFEIVEGQLQQRAVLPVGAPLRDFALTAQVPRSAPDFTSLVDPDQFAYSTPPVDDTRYLFGIDGRDGSVMAFELSVSEQAVALTPLEAPAPARYEVDMQRHARDRLAFDGAVARALDVVDTRYRAHAEWDESQDPYRDKLYCGETSLTQLEQDLKDAKSARPKDQAKIDALEEVRDWTELGSRSDVLRGVFLIVASSDGRLTAIDVHDLDLQCRARAGCKPGEDPVPHSDDSSAAALALRRHARRVLTSEAALPLVTSADSFVSFARNARDADVNAYCPAGYYQPDEDYLVCVTGDTWQARNLTWSVVYEGRTATVSNALLEYQNDAEQITLWGPQGWDFCARGANAADRLKVAITSQPDPDAADCPTYAYGREPELFVIEAHSDRLVLAAQAPDAGEPEPDAGEPEPDAGEPEPDAGEPEPDAGEPEPDAGEPELDAGEPELDAGEPEPDAGAPDAEDPSDPDAGAGDGGGEADAEADAGRDEPEADLDEIVRCHPGFVNAEIRLHDQYLVSYDETAYIHRNHADEAGVCVTDEALDPRLTSRVSGPDWTFQSFSLTFKLAAPQGDREDIAPVVQLTNQTSTLGVLNVDSSSGRADALPSRVRFFPGSGELFIVDGASQGLRRYELEPFQHDGKRFR